MVVEGQGRQSGGCVLGESRGALATWAGNTPNLPPARSGCLGSSGPGSGRGAGPSCAGIIHQTVQAPPGPPQWQGSAEPQPAWGTG